MAGAKEIRTKIKSVQSTKKITKAMEMVAASKTRKAQDTMLKTRPYAEKIREVISHLSAGNTEYKHPFLIKRDVKKAGFIIISSDRGLCGGLNINLFKNVISTMRQFEDRGVESATCLLGNKAVSYFKNIKAKVLAAKGGMGDTASVEKLIGLVKVMLDAYENEELDAIYLCYNNFVNTMTQKPVVQQILPLPISEELEKNTNSWDYIYEPDPYSLLDTLLKRFIESQVYQAVVENNACEQAARMVAMKSASDNADDVINSLQLAYNKARQAAITQELSEIVAGAAAV